MMAAAALTVGQRIRVAGDDGLTRRALLLAPDGDAWELEYEDGGEAVVPSARCSALLAFEEAAPDDGTELEPSVQMTAS